MTLPVGGNHELDHLSNFDKLANTALIGVIPTMRRFAERSDPHPIGMGVLTSFASPVGDDLSGGNTPECVEMANEYEMFERTQFGSVNAIPPVDTGVGVHMDKNSWAKKCCKREPRWVYRCVPVYRVVISDGGISSGYWLDDCRFRKEMYCVKKKWTWQSCN